VYLLMKSVGDYTFQSASYALKNPEYSDTASLIEDVINGVDTNTSSLFSEARVDEFVGWMRDSESDVLPLNDKQMQFTTDVTSEISLLQGPPGTGKTSGATAPAIVSRLLAQEKGACRTLVTGASNKAINEVFKKTVELVDAYDADPETSDELSNVMFLRVSEPPEDYSGTVDPDTCSSRVAFTALYGNEAEEKHITTIRSRLRDRLAGDDDRHIVVFATPRRAWRVGKKVIPDFSLTEGETIDGRVPESKRRRDDKGLYSLFDVLVADEASMMNLPQFLLTGTFYQRGGNLLLSGDHRQLPPVRKHDWSSDFKPSITSLAPHLSVLDFFRLLGGQELNSIDDEKKELLRVNDSTINADIPLHQLERTYRCHEQVSRFLNDWVYEKLDDLNYTSKETSTLTGVSSSTDGVNAAMTPEEPVVVITYDDATHQQSNPLESKIATSLLQVVSQDTTTGIVTPHNAQRGLLETDVKLQSGALDSVPDIDTVERFQGGERDFITVSATVSDPDYIAAESDFLLNLNRLNVAMSRMKKKVVIIASESVFDHIPVDVDEYNDALLWKGLAEESGVSSLTDTSVWKGDITEFTGLDESEFDSETATTTVKIHYL